MWKKHWMDKNDFCWGQMEICTFWNILRTINESFSRDSWRFSKPFITAHASWVNSFQFPVGSSSIPLTNWIVSVASSPPLPKKRTHNLRTQFGDWSRVLSIFWGCYIHTYEHQLCELRASKAGGHQPYTKNTQEGATDMPLLKCPRFAWVQPSICAIRSILSILLLLLLQQFLLFDGFGICKERLEESAGAFLGSCAFVVFSRALSGGSQGYEHANNLHIQNHFNCWSHSWSITL